MPTRNAEIWADFARTTTISGVNYIHEAKHWFLKVLWLIIFATLTLMTTVQCMGAVEFYLSWPTIVNKKMHYRTLNFPSVTFCPNNPFKASKVEELSPELQSMMDELKNTIYKTNTSVDQSSEFADVQNVSLRRSKRQAGLSELCPQGYFRIEGGCYMKINITTNWFKAYNICRNLGANLPIFTNFSNYVSFFRWHNNYYSNEIWVGLYSLNNINWIWTNNCPYNAIYPSFWGDATPRSQNGPLYNRLTQRGILWSDGTESRDVFCYQPLSAADQTCQVQGFQEKPNAPYILCHNSLVKTDSWWCINDHPEYANVTTSVQADSCFCLLFDSLHFEMTADQAAAHCAVINASLADLKNIDELNMLDQLIESFDADDGDLMNACPFNATYANRSCFNFLPLVSASFDQADRNCYAATGGGALMSLHSPYEHNAAFYELRQKSRAYNLQQYGVYLGMYRNYSVDSRLWKWSDGSPFDYMPSWSIWVIPNQPDSSDPEAFLIAVDGLLHDYRDFNTYAMCRKNLNVSGFWTSLTTLWDNETSKTCTFWSNNNCKSVDESISLVADPARTSQRSRVNFMLDRKRSLTVPQNDRAPGAICRRDRKPSDACSLDCASKINDVATFQTNDLAVMPQVFVSNTTDSPQSTEDFLSKVSRVQKQMLYLTEAMDTKLSSQLSYNIEDLLVYSTYDGVYLNFSEFDTKYYKGTGNCFVFNQRLPVRQVNKSGNDKGLGLLLKLNILEYLPISVSPGFLFMIHSPNETIYPDSQALRISTGLQNDVALTYEESYMEPYPYSNCILDAPSGYSTNECYESCAQLAILTYCDCGDPQLPLVGNATYCSYESETCVEAVKSFGNFSPSYYGCSCPPPCKGGSYGRTLSSAKLSLTSAKLAPSFEKLDNNQSINDEKCSVDNENNAQCKIYSESEHILSYIVIRDVRTISSLYAITFFEIIPLVSSLCGCQTCQNIRR